MLLIVGLGNPGAQYAHNRHNVGFMAVDAIHRRHGFAPWRRRLQAEIAEGTLAGGKVLLAKPLTYMNDSGRAVQAVAAFYKLPVADIVVIHDEVDLPPGKPRVKTGGGAAGHNGLRSIDAHMGAGYKRVRLGIGHPGAKALVHSYVLNDFGKAEEGWVDTLCDAVARNVALLTTNDDASFQNRVHLVMEAAGFADPKKVGE